MIRTHAKTNNDIIIRARWYFTNYTDAWNCIAYILIVNIWFKKKTFDALKTLRDTFYIENWLRIIFQRYKIAFWYDGDWRIGKNAIWRFWSKRNGHISRKSMYKSIQLNCFVNKRISLLSTKQIRYVDAILRVYVWHFSPQSDNLYYVFIFVVRHGEHY